MDHPGLRGLAVSFVVLSVVFGLLEARWPSIRGQKRVRAGFWTDAAYWIFTPLVSGSVTRLALIVLALALAAAYGVQLEKEHVRAFLLERHTAVSALPKALQAFLALFLGDCVSYWMHRLFHGRRLWRFHAVHHGSVELDWLSSTRIHPVNEALTRAVEVLSLVVLGFPADVLAAYAPFLILWAIGLHANVDWDFGPLRFVLAGPRFHRWHHTSQEEGLDKNFAGLFPVWDLLFGTYYMPQGAVPTRFGVKGEPVPDGILAQLAYPFKRSGDAGS